MKIFMLPSWYATEDKPLLGIFFTEQARALIRAGHQVYILYPDLRFRLYGLPTGIHSFAGDVPGYFDRCRSFTPFWEQGRWPQREWMLNRLYKLAVKQWGKPDLLHLQSCKMGIEALWLGQKYHLPLVYTEHFTGVMTSLKGPLRTQLRKTLEGASQAIAVSEELKLRMQEFRADTRYIPNMVDSSSFTPAKSQHSGFVFGTLCNLVARKRIDLLLRAFAAADLSNSFLCIGGDGPERRSLEKLAHALKIADRVIFCGRVSRADVCHFYQGCDCIVSTSDIETFGMTLIEALSCGIPILSTKSGGPESIVIPGQNGQLIPCNDEKSLKNGLIQMASYKFDKHHLRADCIARFGEKAVVAQITAVYQQAVRRYKWE
ncbi:MAG TPA: hypothetical protein DEP42_00740 [Ruminococcaceae bacterium]|nr:hypothetical protein [Oscillospiraceae bacterium]